MIIGQDALTVCTLYVIPKEQYREATVRRPRQENRQTNKRTHDLYRSLHNALARGVKNWFCEYGKYNCNTYSEASRNVWKSKCTVYNCIKRECSPKFSMSPPWIEVHIEKVLPKTLGRLRKESPSKRRFEVAFVQHK